MKSLKGVARIVKCTWPQSSWCPIHSSLKLPDALLFQDLPDFLFLTLLSHNTTGSVHNEGVRRDSNAPSEERPVEPQTRWVREQIDEEQQDKVPL